MSEFLDFENFDPETGIQTTKNILGAAADAVVSPSTAPAVASDRVPKVGDIQPGDTWKGKVFDPEIHKTLPNGQPELGSVKQLLMKKSAKKSGGGLVSKAKEFFSGEKKEVPENNENQEFTEEKYDIPKSDHEKEEEVRKNLHEAEKFASDLDIHSEDAASTMWIVYSATLGAEALNQYDRLNPKLKKHFEIFERRTGKSVDLPPGVALAFGLATVGLEIVKSEPECKKRYESARDAVITNMGGYIKNTFGKGSAEIPEQTTEEETAND